MLFKTKKEAKQVFYETLDSDALKQLPRRDVKATIKRCDLQRRQNQKIDPEK